MTQFLSTQTFAKVIENAPLISIDLCIVHQDKILLGKRNNPPAKDFYFTPGGRIYKNEPWQDAMQRIAKDELGIDIQVSEWQLMGMWDHFYKDSIINEDISTHYVNMPYYYELSTLPDLFLDYQHSELSWFELSSCKSNDMIHPYTQNYIQWILNR